MKLEFFAACVAFAAVAAAQSTYCVLTGVIADPSGAVVASAKVEVVNQSTHDVRFAVSNEAGFYRVPDLVPGAYDLSVSAEGFAIGQERALQTPKVIR